MQCITTPYLPTILVFLGLSSIHRSQLNLPDSRPFNSISCCVSRLYSLVYALFRFFPVFPRFSLLGNFNWGSQNWKHNLCTCGHVCCEGVMHNFCWEAYMYNLNVSVPSRYGKTWLSLNCTLCCVWSTVTPRENSPGYSSGYSQLYATLSACCRHFMDQSTLCGLKCLQECDCHICRQPVV